MPIPYTPTSFTKPGSPTETAYSWSDHYQLIWEGYTAGGPAPEPPRSQIKATLADIDDVLAEVDSRPLGARTIAMAANRTGVSTTAGVAPTVTAIPGCIITVPPQGEEIVTLECAAHFGTTVAGNGQLTLTVYELTNGAAVARFAPFINYWTGLAAGFTGGLVQGSAELGVVTEERIFGLYASVRREAASSLAAFVYNLSEASQSVIRAKVGA